MELNDYCDLKVASNHLSLNNDYLEEQRVYDEYFTIDINIISVP